MTSKWSYFALGLGPVVRLGADDRAAHDEAVGSVAVVPLGGDLVDLDVGEAGLGSVNQGC